MYRPFKTSARSQLTTDQQTNKTKSANRSTNSKAATITVTATVTVSFFPISLLAFIKLTMFGAAVEYNNSIHKDSWQQDLYIISVWSVTLVQTGQVFTYFGFGTWHLEGGMMIHDTQRYP
ncbi:hypothetical protein B0H65DRAFT_466515 [Neurospora tetraspora]|uniref:Uncharacterized protein n=1 Tax=Neurospora tetraspora TaxID=94610 RepID=A0AAE0MRW8_9PEZI|nr:hypothetical protein B0H65DRAFT_466515 [Neurospora tetraspora]